MTRITTSDQVLLMLRSHLQRTQRARRKERGGTAKRAETRAGALERVQGIASADTLSDAEIARALLAGLLTDEFGDAVANDPKFQQLVDDVAAMLGRDEVGRDLLGKAVAQVVAAKG